MRYFGKIGGGLFSRLGLLCVGVLLLFVGMVILWSDSLRLPYIPKDFSYSVDVLSTDTFYDQAQQRYAGARYARGTYALQPVGQKNGTTTVQGVLNVTALDREPVATIRRTYDVNERTGQITRAVGHTPQGYLFAPRSLRKGTSFAYWHVTYNAPAMMHYAGEEQLDGLNVYRYDADYRSAGRIEQNDVPIAGVPAGQGLEYAPQLHIWVEPSTGWLIKFEENTTVYYFDRATQQRLGPFNHFSNTVTEASVRQNVQYARSIRSRLIFGAQVAPSITLVLVVFGTVVFLRRWLRGASMPEQLLWCIVAAAPAIGLVGWLLHVRLFATLFVGNVWMNPLASLCFMAIAVSVFCMHWRAYYRLALTLAIGVIGAAGLVILARANLIPFNLDISLLRHITPDNTTLAAAQMSLLTAVNFLVLALCVVCTLGAIRRIGAITARSLAGVTAGLVVLLGVMSLLLQVLLADDTFAATFIGSLSVGTSLLFIISGYTLRTIQQARSGQRLTVASMARELWWPGVVLMPLVFIGVMAQLQHDVVKQQLQAAFDGQVTASERALAARTATYSDMLGGVRALFAASSSVGAHEWHAYVRATGISGEYPGVDEVGFMQVARPETVGPLSQKIRQTGYPTFTVYPDGRRTLYTPVIYIEPVTASTAKTLGYDMFTDATRSEAMERARDSGTVAISDGVTVQREDGSTETTFLLLIPVYGKGAATNTITERRQAIDGYGYVLFNADRYMESALAEQSDTLGIAIYDGLKADDAKPLYQRNGGGNTADANPRLSQTITTYVGNHPWTVRFTARSDFRLSAAQERSPVVVLLGCSALYFLAVAAGYLLLVLRRRAVSPAWHGRYEHR